jgi:hypothetical protein
MFPCRYFRSCTQATLHLATSAAACSVHRSAWYCAHASCCPVSLTPMGSRLATRLAICHSAVIGVSICKPPAIPGALGLAASKLHLSPNGPSPTSSTRLARSSMAQAQPASIYSLSPQTHSGAARSLCICYRSPDLERPLLPFWLAAHHW